MLGNLFANDYEAISMILFGIGFTTLLLNRNMIKKIMGLNIMDTAIYLFLAAKETYINPIPTGLVLTGIVVSVSVTAVMLSLTIRLYRRYHTLDIDEITRLVKEEK